MRKKVRWKGTNTAMVTPHEDGKEYKVNVTFNEQGKVSEIQFDSPLPVRTVTRLQVDILYALRDEIERW